MQIIFLLFFCSLFVTQSTMDLFWALGILLGIWIAFKEKTKSFAPHLWFYFALCFWVVSIASRLVNSAPKDWMILLENRWCLEIVFFTLLARRIIAWPSVIEKMAWAFSGIQVFSYVWFYFLRNNPPPLSERFGGFHTNSMFWAQSTAVLGIFFLGLFLFSAFVKRIKLSLLIASIISILGLLLTQTRGAWISYFLVLPLFLYLWRPKRFLLNFSVLIVLSTALAFGVKPIRERIEFTVNGLNGQATYDTERRALWSANWMMFLDHPILGVGFADNKSHLRPYFDKMGLPINQFESHAHNQYLQVLGGTGLLGIISYLGIFLTFVFYAWKVARSQNVDFRAVGWSCLGSLLVFMIASLTEANFNISKTRYALFFIWVMILAFWPRRLDYPHNNDIQILPK